MVLGWRIRMRSVLVLYRRRLMRLALRTALVVTALVVWARIAMVHIAVRAGVIRVVRLCRRSERAKSLVAPPIRIRRRRTVRRR